MDEVTILDKSGQKQSRPMSGNGQSNGNQPVSFVKEFVDRQKQSTEDPFEGMGGSPPNLGRFVLPHVQTFQGLFGSYSRAYRAGDEALRHSRENARYMRNDCGIMECVESRQRALALLDWELVPEDEGSDDQKQLCTELTNIVKRIKSFTDYRYVLSHAQWYGRYGIQHRYGWQRVGDKMYVMPKKKRDNPGWLPINGDKLVFRYDDGRVYTPANGGISFPDQVGILVGARHQAADRIGGRWTVEPTGRGLAYFLADWERATLAIHKHIIEDGDWHDSVLAGNIHGVGIRSRIYWDWFQKQEMLAFLVSYLERSAGGIEIWTYPAGDPKAKQEAEAAAKNRLADGRNVIMFPKPMGAAGDDYDIRVVEPGLAGIDVLQHLLENYYGHRIKRYILGQTLSSEADATGMGSGLAELHMDTLMQIIRYDAQKLEETITDELVERIKLWNFPHAKNIHVRFAIKTEAPDIEAKLEAWAKAYEMGAALKERDVMDLIGAGIPTDDDRVLQNPQSGGQGDPGMGGGGPGGFPPGGGGFDPNDPNGPGGGGQGHPGQDDGPSTFGMSDLPGDRFDKAFGRSDQYAVKKQKTMDWDETKHPRADDGKFGSGGGSKASGEVGERGATAPKTSLSKTDIQSGLDELLGPHLSSGRSGAIYWNVKPEGKPHGPVVASVRMADHAPVYDRSSADVYIVTGGKTHQSFYGNGLVIVLDEQADASEVISNVTNGIISRFKNYKIPLPKCLIDPENYAAGKFDESKHPRADDGKFGSGGGATDTGKERGATAISKGDKFRVASKRARLNVDQMRDMMGERGYSVGAPKFDMFQKTTLYPVARGDGEPRFISAKEIGAFLATEDSDIFGDGGDSATDSPEFKAWFGDSKVVDEDGAPLVVYHGTRSDFNSFNEGLVFFSDNPDLASSYAVRFGKSSLDSEFDSLRAKLQDSGVNMWDVHAQPEWKELEVRARQEGANVIPSYVSISMPFEIDAGGDSDLANEIKGGPEMVEGLKRDGYDGIVIRNGFDRPLSYTDEDAMLSSVKSDVWVAFSPNQIKSATGNRGTFDPDDDRITYSAPTDQYAVAAIKKYDLQVGQTKIEDGTVYRLNENHRWELLETSDTKPTAPASKTEATTTAKSGKSKGETRTQVSFRMSDGSDFPEHLAKLRIPPAWKGVKVNIDPDAKVLATGVDEKGRRQTIYSAKHEMIQAAIKFEKTKELIKKFPDIVSENSGNLHAGDATEEAAALALILATGIRPGSDSDTGADKQAYGATTLRSEHVTTDGDGNVVLRFTGKKGVDLSIPVDDPDLSEMLLVRAKRGGRLFDTNGSRLLKYSRTLDGGKFRPKDYRTAIGTMTAQQQISDMGCCPHSDKEYKSWVRSVAENTSKVLGNTPTIALQSYIDPTVFGAWRGALA